MAFHYTDNLTVLATTTSTIVPSLATVFDLSTRQAKSIQFIASGITSGHGVFGIDISNDGTNWDTYKRLIPNITNTASQNDTRVAAPTLSAATNTMCFFDPEDYFRYMRVYVTVTTDGTYSAIVEAAG